MTKKVTGKYGPDVAKASIYSAVRNGLIFNNLLDVVLFCITDVHNLLIN